MLPGTSTTLNRAFALHEGDHFWGVPEFSITIQNVAPTDDVASAIMQFRPFPLAADDETVLVEWTSAAAEIVIEDANAWTFSIPKQALALTAGKYTYAFQATDAAGVIQTYITGEIEIKPRLIITT